MTTTPAKRIAINNGGGYVPGLNTVFAGATLAANEMGWEVIGIRDGFDGLLFPERYPEGGTVPLSQHLVETLSCAAGPILGTAAKTDPFHVRNVDSENQVVELDWSSQLLERLRKDHIEGVISIVGARNLGILRKLHRKGLRIVCVPTSVENDIAGTALSFGFNSALSYATEMLDRLRQAAQAARKIGVVEVLGEHAGWLALQAGIAVCADAVLIPEIPYDLTKVAAKVQRKLKKGLHSGLVVVAEGATPLAATASQTHAQSPHPLRHSLCPAATGAESSHVIERSGQAAETIALQLQRQTDHETYPLVLGPLVKAGAPTAVDRQLGLGYGAAAVRAIKENQTGVMVVFQPPEVKFVPLAEAINRIRTVPTDSVFLQVARSLGIALGD